MDPEGELPFGVPDEAVTAVVDAREHVDAKLAAMRAHATQIAVDGPFFALSNNLGNEVWGREAYTLVRGARGPAGPPESPGSPGTTQAPGTPRPADAEGPEADLFAGLD
jgi:LmbE family N-acetylglucosaminyl deacetylase